MTNDTFNRWCEESLAAYTRRDGQVVPKRLDSLRNTLRWQGNHVVQTIIGGTVRRGTDVPGLSDVDALLIVDESSLRSRSPADVMEYVRHVIRRQPFFFISGTVSASDLAVTVNYSGGTEIQLLPALRTSGGGIRISEPGMTGWRNVVRPEKLVEEDLAVAFPKSADA